MTYYLKGSRSKERMHDRYPVMKEKVKLEIEASSCDVIVLDRKGMMQGKRRQLRFTKKKKMFCTKERKGRYFIMWNIAKHLLYVRSYERQ